MTDLPHAPNADLPDIASVVVNGAVIQFPHSARVVIESRLQPDGSRAIWIRIEETKGQIGQTLPSDDD